MSWKDGFTEHAHVLCEQLTEMKRLQLMDVNMSIMDSREGSLLIKNLVVGNVG